MLSHPLRYDGRRLSELVGVEVSLAGCLFDVRKVAFNQVWVKASAHLQVKYLARFGRVFRSGFSDCLLQPRRHIVTEYGLTQATCRRSGRRLSRLLEWV